MKYQRIAVCLLALTTFAVSARSDRAPVGHRWFYLNANHHGRDTTRIDADISVLKLAAACGYNGVVFEDVDLGLLDRMPATYVPNVQRFVAAAARAGVEIVPQVAVPYGERVLRHDPNLAEGLRVDGALFVVHGNRLDLQPDRPRLAGGAAHVFPHRAYRITATSPV